MANRESALIEITPEVLLKAYACGIFPMAESAGSSRSIAFMFRRGSRGPCAPTDSP